MTSSIATVLGVAIFGTLYLGFAPTVGRGIAIHAFTIVTFAFAATALLGAGAASLSIRRSRVASAIPDHRETARSSQQRSVADEAEQKA